MTTVVGTGLNTFVGFAEGIAEEVIKLTGTTFVGNHTATTVGGMSGQFELNVFKPLMIRNMLHSIKILSDGMRSFEKNLAVGIKADEKRISTLLNQRHVVSLAHS